MKWECTYYHALHVVCVHMIVGTLAFHGIIILYRCKYINVRKIKLKRSAVAIAPDSAFIGYGMGCKLLHVRSVNRISLRQPF